MLQEKKKRMLQAVERQKELAISAARKTNIIGVLFDEASCVYTKVASTQRSLLLNCSTLSLSVEGEYYKGQNRG